MEGLFGKYRVLLAPMAGVSDIAFRTLCREAGADMAFTEMVSAKGLSFANEKTRHLLALADGESQVAVQLFGHEPDVMASQAAWIEQEMGEGLAYLDINMGCPARKIVSKGDGSALMKDPALAASIVRAVKRAVEHPVTVKFRRGWAEGDETAPAFARLMEEAGADGVTVHGRFAEQLYRGSADWGVIARVREAVSVPVVGNGDIRSGADAVAMAAETGCDAVMIARAPRETRGCSPRCRPRLSGRRNLHRLRLRNVSPWRVAMRSCSPIARGAISCACASTPCGIWRDCPAPPLPAGASTTARRSPTSTPCSTSFWKSPGSIRDLSVSHQYRADFLLSISHQGCPSNARRHRNSRRQSSLVSKAPWSVFPRIAAPSIPSAELARLQCLLASDYSVGKRGPSWLTIPIRHSTCTFRSA